MKTRRTSLFRPTGFATAIALLLAFGIGSPVAAQIELLTNGDFETGTFAGWTLANQLNPADARDTIEQPREQHRDNPAR